MIASSSEVIPIIRAALDRGQGVRMTVTGSSMLPFLRDSDVVELEPVTVLRMGDMVLVQTAKPGEGERYVLHRIVRLEGSAAFFIRGDAQPQCEGPFAADALLGRVATAWRDGRARAHHRGIWHFAGLIWARCRPLGKLMHWLAVRIRRWGGFVLRKRYKASMVGA